MALGSTQPLTEMSTRSISWGGKSGRCVRLTTLPPSCGVVTRYGNLKFLETSGPVQACNGTALPFYHNCYPISLTNLESKERFKCNMELIYKPVNTSWLFHGPSCVRTSSRGQRNCDKFENTQAMCRQICHTVRRWTALFVSLFQTRSSCTNSPISETGK